MNLNLILTVVNRLIEPTFLAIALTICQGETVLALGCDTQERISGEISGCNDISTQDSVEIDMKKYGACVEELLSAAIANYKNNRGDYYATWQWQEEQAATDIASQKRPIQLQLEWMSICYE